MRHANLLAVPNRLAVALRARRCGEEVRTGARWQRQVLPPPTVPRADREPPRRQLGLQLESAKSPVKVIVVDHAERPKGNQ
jgi:hypothetical protein